MLRSEFLSRVRRRIQDETADNAATRWTDAQLTLDAEEALRHLQSLVSSKGMQHLFRRSVSIVTVADSEFYPLPGDFRHIVALRRTDVGEEEQRVEPLVEAQKSHFTYSTPGFIIDTSSVGGSTYSRALSGYRYWVQGNQLGLRPIPQEAVTFRLDYIYRLSFPSSDAEVLDVPDEMLNAFIAYTSICALQSVNEDPGLLAQQFAGYRRQMLNDLGSRIHGQLPEAKAPWRSQTDLSDVFA